MSPIYSSTEPGTQRSFSQWREVMNETFFSIGCAPSLDDSTFQGSISHLAAGDAELYAIGSEAVHYERRADDIRRNNSDTCQLFLVLDGQVHIEQHGRHALVEPGQSCMYAAGEPFSLHMPGKYRSLVLSMPRPLLSSRLDRFDSLTARTLRGDKGMSRLIGQMMRETSCIDRTAVGDIALKRLGAPMTELAALALEVELDGCTRPATRHSQLLERVKSRMFEELDNADIDVKQLASDLGVGIRTVNRMFAAEGTTAMRWLWQQRLTASHRLLSEGRTTRIADVALSCGFSDFSHFSRSFKREFGVPPNSLLKKIS